MGFVESLPNVCAASFLCSGAIVEFTIPQVVNLSKASGNPLPPAPFYPNRAMIFARAIGPQTGITIVQFSLVKKLRDVLDDATGERPVNLSLAYGTASVPLVAAKYNLLISDVYKYYDRAAPANTSGVVAFWKRNIAPGLLWSFLRDSGSVGGGVVLGPIVSAKLTSEEKPSLPVKFAGGVLSGSVCGLATQVFHNAALTAGRMAEAGESPGTMECMRRVFAEHGPRALYFNFPYRVAIIAYWTGVLNVTQPFAK
jgi:hypothetical protein